MHGSRRMKQLAEKEYNLYLMWVRRAIGNQVTYASTLEELCRYLFGDTFIGVFARDEVPPKGGYALINLDDSDMPGSHWVGRAGHHVYDSFGRNVGMAGRQSQTQNRASSKTTVDSAVLRFYVSTTNMDLR